MQVVQPEVSERSRAAWDADLRQLLREADALFADVAWHDEISGATIHAHKFVLYARASGAFQQTFLGVPHSLSETGLSRNGQSSTSLRTFTPTSATTDRPPTAVKAKTANGEPTDVLRATWAGPARLSLHSADVPVFKAALEWFYTAAEEDEAFRTVLDGFQDGCLADSEGATGVERLRQDLLYSWRSKLYADVSLLLDGAPGGPFAAHRAMLAVRSPYFRSLLLGEYSDSAASTLALPSPPFTPASTTFILGYLYSGTLDFSTRKFDLSTAFELWRCAAFLGLSTLQDELEGRICSTLTLQRAARVFAFARAPDVGSDRLATATMPYLVEHLDPTWVATPHVGEVDYDAQKRLVRAACDNVRPDNVASVAVQVAACRRKLAAASWAEHVRAMLEAIEAQLVDVLATNLDEVVRSVGFNDLVDGVGFNSDVLEWLLGLLVKGLTEAKAAQAYQVLVEKVLLRERGLRADARILVEDARVGIVRYLKRKWDGVRQLGGFNIMAPQFLEELVVELDVPVEDLLGKHPAACPPATRSRRPPLHLIEGRPSPVKSKPPVASSENFDIRPTPRASMPTRGAAFGAVGSPRRQETTTTHSPATRSSSGRISARGAAASSLTAGDITTFQSPLLSRSSTARPPIARTREAPRPSFAPTYADRRPSSASTHRDNTAPRTQRRAQMALPQENPRSFGTATSQTPSASTVTARSASTTPRTSSRPDARQALATQRSVAQESLHRVPRRDRSSSTSTTTSRSLPRPPSTSSIKSTSAAQTSVPSVLGRSRKSSQAASSLRPAAANSPRSSASHRAHPSGREQQDARSSAVAIPRRPVQTGTSLLAPIPCIVTVRCGRLCRIRAQVRYIGPLDGQQGDWVGVEAALAAIPDEALTLPWGDGARNGVAYFDLSTDDAPGRGQAVSALDDATLDSRAPSGPPPPPAAKASPDPSDSLRPLSRRARRSASSDRSSTDGTRKALFVRPHQIVYVL